MSIKCDFSWILESFVYTLSSVTFLWYICLISQRDYEMAKWVLFCSSVSLPNNIQRGTLLASAPMFIIYTNPQSWAAGTSALQLPWYRLLHELSFMQDHNHSTGSDTQPGYCSFGVNDTGQQFSEEVPTPAAQHHRNLWERHTCRSPSDLLQQNSSRQAPAICSTSLPGDSCAPSSLKITRLS